MPARDVAGRGFAATRRISARGVRVPVEVGWHDPFRREGGRGVSAKRKSKKNTAALRDERCFRHWVELRDLRDDVVRVLSVAVFQRIALVSKSKLDEPEQSPQISLRVQDVGRVWEASSVEDLAAQLREAYPDGVFVRTLKCERDLEAEARRRTALNNLIEVLAEATVRQMLEEGPAADSTQVPGHVPNRSSPAGILRKRRRVRSTEEA